MSAKRDIMWKRGQEQIKRLIMSGKWGRIGHTLMKTTTNITRQTLKWSPQGEKREGGMSSWTEQLAKGLNLTSEEYVQLS